MCLSEERVINLLADAIQDSNIIITILSATVTLDGAMSLLTGSIDLFQKIRQYDIVSI